MAGLLDIDPWLAAGLTILGSNQGRNAGAAIPAGMAAFSRFQQDAAERERMRQEQEMRQQEMQMRQQQFGMQQTKFDLEQEQYRKAQEQAAQQQQYVEEVIATMPPDIQRLMRANPELAWKMVEAKMNPTKPQLGLTPKIGINKKTGKPEFVQPSATGDWVWSGITPTENELAIARYVDETGNYPGSSMPQGNAAPQPPQNNAPQNVPVPSAMPYSWSGTFDQPNNTDRAEGTSPTMPALRNPALPAKTQRALEQKSVEAQIDISKQRVIDQNQANINVDAENKKETNKKSRSMAGLGSVIDQARVILTTLEPTASGVGTAADKAAGFFGMSTQGSVGASKLKALGGNLIMKMPRMEGPQSNLDQELYREMAGRIGDSTVPVNDRLAALDVVESLFRKYDKESNIIPSGEQMPAKRSNMSSGGWSARKVK